MIKAIRQTKHQTRNVTEQSQNGRDFPIFAKIAALMGFSWLFGFLAMLISKYLWYPFTILTTLQGVYIATAFVFCAPRVRKLYYNLFTEKLGRNIVHSAGVGAIRQPSNFLLTTSTLENNFDSDYTRTRTISETQLWSKTETVNPFSQLLTVHVADELQRHGPIQFEFLP